MYWPYFNSKGVKPYTFVLSHSVRADSVQMNKTQSFEGIIGPHHAIRRGGCQSHVATGGYTIGDLDYEFVVVGSDWWINVIHAHDQEYLGFRCGPAGIPHSINALAAHFNGFCWQCRGEQ